MVHGLSVPIGILGYHLPRTLSSAIGSRTVSEDPDEPEEPFHIRDRVNNEAQAHHRRDTQRSEQRREGPPRREVFRIGRSTIPSGNTTPKAVDGSKDDTKDTIELSTPKERPETGADDSQSGVSKQDFTKKA